MAFFDDSLLLNGQATLNARMQAGEMKFTEPVMTKTLRSYQDICTPDWRTLKTNETRAFQIDFFNRNVVSNGSAKSHTHTYSFGASSLITPTFADVTNGFRMAAKQATKSTRTQQEFFNYEFENTMINLSEGYESSLIDDVIAGRDGLVRAGTDIEGTFNATNDAFEISDAASGDYVFQIASSRLDIIGYAGVPMDVFCDTVAFNRFKRQMAQGVQNATNLQFQFEVGNVTFYHVPTLFGKIASVDAGYTLGTFLMIPQGTATVLDWTSSLNREGAEFNDYKYGASINPINNLIVGSHEIEEGGDSTSVGGAPQDVFMDVQMTHENSFVQAPFSTANESSIFLYAIVA